MKKFRKSKSLVLALGFLLSGCSTTGSEQDPSETTIRIGYQIIPNGDPIVRNSGWLEESLDAEVEWLQFSSGAEVNIALQSQQIDIGLVGSNPAVIGISGNLGYSIVWVFNLIGENEALVVNPESGIRSGVELIGKAIAVPFGSTAHYSLLSYLSLQGLDEGDVRLLDLQPQDALAAWVRGDVDGAYVWNPVLSDMKESGGTVITDSAELAEQGFPTADLAVARNEFINSYPELVQAWVTSQARAVEFIRENPAEASSIISKEFGYSQTEAAQQLSEVVLLDKVEQRQFFNDIESNEPSSMYRLLAETGSFLYEQGRIGRELSDEDLQAGIDSRFLLD